MAVPVLLPGVSVAATAVTSGSSAPTAATGLLIAGMTLPQAVAIALTTVALVAVFVLVMRCCSCSYTSSSGRMVRQQENQGQEAIKITSEPRQIVLQSGETLRRDVKKICEKHDVQIVQSNEEIPTWKRWDEQNVVGQRVHRVTFRKPSSGKFSCLEKGVVLLQTLQGDVLAIWEGEFYGSTDGLDRGFVTWKDSKGGYWGQQYFSGQPLEQKQCWQPSEFANLEKKIKDFLAAE